MFSPRLASRHNLLLLAIAALIIGQVTSVVSKKSERRKAIQAAAILTDPLAKVAMPNTYAIEVADDRGARTGDAQWQDYCRRARVALIQEARAHSTQVAQNN